MAINIYGDIFAKVYHLYWYEYIEEIKGSLINFISKLSPSKILDLCCGTGRLTGLLADQGYDIEGLDLSKSMLNLARLKFPRINFLESDARNFTLPKRYSLIISTFDSLNHMENVDDLSAVFSSVYRHLVNGGCFMFDLNTIRTLRAWDFVDVEDEDNFTMVMYGKYVPEEKRAYTRVTGFLKQGELYSKFNEVMTNTLFELKLVKNLLEKIGYNKITFHIPDNLESTINDPELLERVMLVCWK